MSNILNAIMNLVDNPEFMLQTYMTSHNRANSTGESLEKYIKDLFAGTINEIDVNYRKKRYSSVFSYLGNSNNPPDAILKRGDAIEIKKIESPNSWLAFNSSYPKAKLYANSTMITDACRKCEDWTIKDMIYAVGVVDKSTNRLTSLALVCGEDYCADNSVYERIKDNVKSGISDISGLNFEDTNELGRINRVDPLGITYLRIRGMWGIMNPFKVFDYVYQRDRSRMFNFMAIINNDKYYLFMNRTTFEQIYAHREGMHIEDIEIYDPNNPAKLKEAKLITYTI